MDTCTQICIDDTSPNSQLHTSARYQQIDLYIPGQKGDSATRHDLSMHLSLVETSTLSEAVFGNIL